MGHPYLPLTDPERRQMEKVIGLQDHSELFQTIQKRLGTSCL